MAITSEVVQQRFRETFELFEVGLEMRRAQLRREHPEAADAEIEQLLQAWLRHRPGAEEGDAGPEGFRPRQLAP
jgi:hypothetical protein